MARVDPQVKALLVARLRELRASGEPIGNEVRRAAAGLEVGARSVWRWVADFDPATSAASDGGGVSGGIGGGAVGSGYELTEADVDSFASWGGNVAAVHRQLHAGREGGLSLRRLQYAFGAQLTPGQRAGLVEGAEGRRRFEVYLRWDPPGRNAMWEADHVELPVLELMGSFHPIYDEVEPELLALIDEHVGHGNLRHWAAFTHSAAELCARTDRERIDEDIARNAFAVHGAGITV